MFDSWVDVALVLCLVVAVVGLVAVLVLFALFILSSTGVIFSVDYDQAVQQFKDLAGTEDVVVISHSHLTSEVDFSLRIKGIPVKGVCEQFLNDYLVCTLEYPIRLNVTGVK